MTSLRWLLWLLPLSFIILGAGAWFYFKRPNPIVVISAPSSHGYGLAFGDDRTLAVWDGPLIKLCSVQTNHIETQLDRPGRLSGSLLFSPDGKMMASVEYIGDIVIWDTKLWQPCKARENKRGVPNLFDALDNSFVRAAFSPDSKLLATSHWHRSTEQVVTGEIRIWDVGTGDLLQSIENQPETQELAFSPDGALLASALEREVRLWETKTWQSQGSFKAACQGPGQIGFTPDGLYLANGRGWGQGLAFWNVEDKKQTSPLHLPGSYYCIGPFAFSPDRRTLAVALLSATFFGHPLREAIGRYSRFFGIPLQFGILI
jgi:WD40 repeat protein